MVDPEAGCGGGVVLQQPQAAAWQAQIHGQESLRRMLPGMDVEAMHSVGFQGPSGALEL